MGLGVRLAYFIWTKTCAKNEMQSKATSVSYNFAHFMLINTSSPLPAPPHPAAEGVGVGGEEEEKEEEDCS